MSKDLALPVGLEILEAANLLYGAIKRLDSTRIKNLLNSLFLHIRQECEEKGLEREFQVRYCWSLLFALTTVAIRNHDDRVLDVLDAYMIPNLTD